MNKLINAIPLSILLLGNAAQAEGLYLGAGLGLSQTDIKADLVGTASSTLTNFNLDDQAAGWKLFAGYRLLDMLALELSYIDLGQFEGKGNVGDVVQFNLDYDTQLYSLSAVGHYQVMPMFSLLARTGIYRWSGDAKAIVTALGSADTVSVSDDGTRIDFGLGAQLDFGAFGARLEWQRFNNIGEDMDYDLFMLSGMYSF